MEGGAPEDAVPGLDHPAGDASRHQAAGGRGFNHGALLKREGGQNNNDGHNGNERHISSSGSSPSMLVLPARRHHHHLCWSILVIYGMMVFLLGEDEEDGEKCRYKSKLEYGEQEHIVLYCFLRFVFGRVMLHRRSKRSGRHSRHPF